MINIYIAYIKGDANTDSGIKIILKQVLLNTIYQLNLP